MGALSRCPEDLRIAPAPRNLDPAAGIPLVSSPPTGIFRPVSDVCGNAAENGNSYQPVNDMRHILADRLREGEVVVGPIMSAGYPLCVTELLAGLGFDFAWLDLEHGEMDLTATISHIRMARRCGMATIMRVPSANDLRIQPLLDAGVQAVVFAQTETEEQARQQVAVCKFAPLGRRSVTNRRGFTDYLQRDVGTLLEETNRNTLVLPQIESTAAVEDIDALLSVDGVGGAMMGQTDLAVDMGLPGKTSDPAVMAASKKVCDACRGAGKTFAVYSNDLSILQELKSAGARILITSSILSMIGRAAEEPLRRLKEREA